MAIPLLALSFFIHNTASSEWMHSALCEYVCNLLPSQQHSQTHRLLSCDCLLLSSCAEDRHSNVWSRAGCCCCTCALPYTTAPSSAALVVPAALLHSHTCHHRRKVPSFLGFWSKILDLECYLHSVKLFTTFWTQWWIKEVLQKIDWFYFCRTLIDYANSFWRQLHAIFYFLATWSFWTSPHLYFLNLSTISDVI